MAIFSPPSLSWLGGEGGSGSDNGSDNGGGGGGGGSGAGGSPRADADAGADADAEFADVVGEMIEQEGQAMSPWWDPGAPPSHADDAEAPPPSPPSPPGGLSRAFTALGTVGTSLSSLFSKAPPPLLSGAPHQRAAVLSRSAPPAQPYQTLLPGVTAAAAAQSTAAAAAAAVDAAQATAPAAAGTTRGRRRSTLSGQRERQRQQVESATLALGSTWLQRKRLRRKAVGQPQAGPKCMPVTRLFTPRLRSVSERPRSPAAAAAVDMEGEEEEEEAVPRISLEPHTLHLASPRGELPSVHINHIRKTV